MTAAAAKAGDDPYTPQQRGHVSRVTLSLRTPLGYRVEYDVHRTRKDITATINSG